LFLDIGTHVGERLPGVLDPQFGFERVVCFEPASACWPYLERFGDPRITICRFGLSNETTQAQLFDPGTVRARTVEVAGVEETAPETAQFVRATDWFREHVRPDDEVFMKLNVEGGECDILEDLLDSGEIAKVSSALVHFDVRKFPSLRHREEEVRGKFSSAGVNSLVDADSVPGHTRVSRVQRWLRDAGASRYESLGPADRFRSRRVWLRHTALPGVIRRLHLATLARRILPARTYQRIRSKLLWSNLRARSGG
jgi:FkbM family methyltransferase